MSTVPTYRAIKDGGPGVKFDFGFSHLSQTKPSSLYAKYGIHKRVYDVTPCVSINQPKLCQSTNSQGFSCNSQLLSPISPSMQPSPIASQFTSAPSTQQPNGTQCNLVPIKGFVHKVLRRSRTSSCVLQTALCYLKAIRSNVPQLIKKEKTGHGVQREPDLTDRIVQGDLKADKPSKEGASLTLEF